MTEEEKMDVVMEAAVDWFKDLAYSPIENFLTHPSDVKFKIEMATIAKKAAMDYIDPHKEQILEDLNTRDYVYLVMPNTDPTFGPDKLCIKEGDTIAYQEPHYLDDTINHLQSKYLNTSWLTRNGFEGGNAFIRKMVYPLRMSLRKELPSVMSWNDNSPKKVIAHNIEEKFKEVLSQLVEEDNNDTEQ